MQGYVYTRDNNRTKEAVVVDKNSGKTIALSSFSGYMAFSGGIISEGMKTVAETAKGAAKATIIGKVFSIADGVISGVFDKQGNPDKSMNDVVGTAATAILMGETGAKIGAGIGSIVPLVGTASGGAIGAVVGGVVGSVGGAIWGEDFYEGGISAMSKTMDLADEISDSLSDYLNGVFADDSLPPFHDNKATNPNFLNPYLNPFTSLTIYDPLILDLNGDGIETTTLKDGVYFDHNGDDISFKTSWVDKNDALLVLDKNLNNQIDNRNELFGNFTEISNSNNSNKTFAINGFHALKEYDLNNDNIIDSKDDIYKNLKLRQDKNSNGLVDNDELFTLEEKGIKSINLNFKEDNKNLNEDNAKEFSSTFTKFDGSSNEIADVNFKVDSRDSIYNKGISLDDKYANLTNLKGYGFLRDLKVYQIPYMMS